MNINPFLKDQYTLPDYSLYKYNYLRKETGLKDIEPLEGFKETIKYFFKFKNQNILKFVTFYLAETKTEEVKISGEHIGYKWLPYKKALEQLAFKNAKEILRKANNYLMEHGEENRF